MLNSSEELTLDYPLKADKEIHLPELIPPFKSPAFQIEQAIYTEAERRLDLATANRWDDVSVHLFGEQEKSSDAKDELEENTLLGIGISIKLPFWNQNTATIQQAKSARDLSKHRQAILAESINLSIMNAQENLTQSHRLCLQSNGQILTLAEQNHQAFQDAYLQGQASLVQVQRAQELQLELKNKALDSLVNYYRAKAELRYLLNDYPTLQLPE